MSKKDNSSHSSCTSGYGLSANNPNSDPYICDELTQPRGVREAEYSDSASTTNLKLSEKCVYDSRLSDSGVWSGSNIQSEEIYTPESPVCKSSEFTYSTEKVEGENKSFMALDSGIDVSVSQQFSELNLSGENVSNLNDLSSKSKPRNSKSSRIVEEPVSSGLKNPTLLQSCFQPNEDGDTKLHLAIFHKFIEAVYGMVRMVPHPDYLNIRNDDRQTPLHLAVLTQQPRLVRLLVCAGVALDILDRSGNTALHLAVQADDLACVQAIIEPVKTPEVDAMSLKYTPYPFHGHTAIADIHNYSGQTCVHIAALNGNIDILRYLFWFGADINAKEWKGGQTCLHLAVERKDLKLCMFLLAEKGLNADEADYSGYTAYQAAAYCSWDKDIVKALRDHGVDTFIPSDSETGSSDEEMVDVSDISLNNGFKMNGSGLVNVGA